MAIDKQSLRRKMLSLEQAVIASAERGYQEYLRDAQIDRDETVEDVDQAASEASSPLAERFEQQVHEHEQHIEQIRLIDFGPRTDVGPGAVVKLEGSDRRLIIAVPTSAFECDGVEYLGISSEAPLYEVMEGLEAGDEFEFNGSEKTIEAVD